MENPEFLKKKYDLHNAPEVEKAALRTGEESGEKVSQDPSARIENYLDRLERLAMDPEKEQARVMFGKGFRPRALGLLREMVMNKYVRPHRERMAEGAARVEERAAREMGIEAHYGGEELEQRGEIAVADLEKSLDNWIYYLSDANEPYPTWFRYYVFRNVLDLTDYDKDKREFSKRSPGSFRLFPEIDRGALGYIEERIEAAKDPEMLEKLRKAQMAAANQDIPESELLTKEKAESFAKMSFAKQYAEGIKQAGEITPEMREETRGEWKKYQQGTDPTALWASLQNKGTAWCTKGFATAETQLKGGDFYVYYTYDKQGKPAIPRIAIRMQGETIGEVRGVADNDQNLEGNMADIAERKMKELPGAESYRKKSADMKQLTLIEKKTQKGEPLSKEDLTFLYELNSPIEGFGYQRDPRIAEFLGKRNPEADMPVVFDCEKNQIARNVSEIKEGTEAYIGPLVPGIFVKIQEYNIEHIYTSFPGKKIRREKVEIGGKSADQLISEMETVGINISDYAKSMLQNNEFVPSNSEEATLVRLTVADLGFETTATTDQIYERAQILGLELCPVDTGPNYRLKYRNQPSRESLLIGMKQIVDSGNIPYIFKVNCDDGLCLCDHYAAPSRSWHPTYKFVFRLRKPR